MYQRELVSNWYGGQSPLRPIIINFILSRPIHHPLGVHQIGYSDKDSPYLTIASQRHTTKEAMEVCYFLSIDISK